MSVHYEDRIILHEIIARLGHAVDRQDWNDYLSHFDEDAVMEPGFAPPSRGLEAIAAFLRSSEAGTSGKRHVCTNVYIDGDLTTAIVSSYLSVFERDDFPSVVATARITDTLVKRAGKWKVTKHHVEVDPGMFKAYQATQAGRTPST